ncbi:MAG: class I SAM-dependent methyltransferase [candidate division WOR-3 bacterium]
MQRYRLLYSVRDLPVFQNRVYNNPFDARNCPKGDVSLVEDMETGLVKNIAYESQGQLYDENYQNEQSYSQTFRSHLEQVSRIIKKHFTKRNRLIEIGCGKGYFLELLLALGFDVIGFDPAYEGSNPRVIKQYFFGGLEKRADGIILRHVLEHIPNPLDFLEKLKAENGGALIYIEVPCFEWICKKRAWFDIYYEHVNYFRLKDFYRMFDDVLDAGKFFNDQYLYVVAKLESFKRPKRDPLDPIIFPDDFLSKIRYFSEKISNDRKNGRKIVIWGASSKGVIFSLLMERMGTPVDIAIDINPFKQGKFLPGTGIEVHSPESGINKLPVLSSIYVMNSIYIKEIKEIVGEKIHLIGVDDE